MTEQERFRYRLGFHKMEAMRFTGHLDLYRALERSIRRAGLPLAYRAGFGRHPRLQLASALPLGFLSQSELADVWLERQMAPSEVLERLNAAAPPGLRFVEACAVSAREPALQEQVTGAAFVVVLEEPVPEGLEDRVRLLLASPAVIRQRRGKPYDLRPLIDGLAVAGPGSLSMRLSAREGATGRPDEVLEALGLDPLTARIERTGLVLSVPAAR